MQFFYHPDFSNPVFELLPEEAKHCVKALRKKTGDEIFITNGLGQLATAQLIDDNLNHCSVQIIDLKNDYGLRPFHFHLAIAPTKNADRIEWMVEKCIEIGIEKISFIRCEHSERIKLDINRLQRIAISAIKQSNTTLIPDMRLIDYADFIGEAKNGENHFIAWCDENNHEEYAQQALKGKDTILLIGPEGDFSPAEIQMASENGYKEVKLGSRRLRTETAGLYGCCVFASANL